MPRQEHLLGWAPSVASTPPQPVTEMKPGRAIVFTEKNTGNTIIYSMDEELAAKVGTELKGEDDKGKKVVLPNSSDIQTLLGQRPQG